MQEDERMEQIQRLRTEKDQIFQPVKKDTDNLQAVMNTVGEAGDVMHLSQNVVETFIDRVEVFNNERVKIRFTFEDTLSSLMRGYVGLLSFEWHKNTSFCCRNHSVTKQRERNDFDALSKNVCFS